MAINVVEVNAADPAFAAAAAAAVAAAAAAAATDASPARTNPSPACLPGASSVSLDGLP